MNDRLLEILAARPDFNVSGENKKRLDFFAEYLDHGSLFLFGFEPDEDPVFIFTNDARKYRFRMSEIQELVTKMRQGVPMDWDEVEKRGDGGRKGE